MLRSQKTVRLLASPTFTNISVTNKVNTHTYTTLLSAHHNKLIHAHGPPAADTHDSRSTASFSTNSHGLKRIMWTEYTCADLYRSSDTRFVVNARFTADTDSNLEAGPDDVARIAFEQSNPFNDPEALNCLVVFEHVVEDGFGIYGYIVKEHIAASFLSTEAKILQEGLDEAVKAAGKSIEWPIIMKLIPRYGYADVHVAIKIPSNEDPKAFEAQLRAMGLKRGEFLFGEAAMDDEWWHRLLLHMHEEQKYWVG